MGSGLGPRTESRKPKMCFTIAVVHLKPHLDAGHSKHWSKSAFFMCFARFCQTVTWFQNAVAELRVTPVLVWREGG